MIEDLLTPVPRERMNSYRSLNQNQWGYNIWFFQDELPDLKDIDLAIIGVKEERGTTKNCGTSIAPDFVRAELYKLIKHTTKLNLIDLGNIEQGSKVTDTYFALSTVVFELIKHNVVPIIIGGSHDLTYAQYTGYQNFNKNVNLVVADEKIDLDDMREDVSDNNHLMKILTYDPNYLGNFIQLGYQSYFTDPKAVEILDKLNFECYRLGEIRKNMEEVEPIIRNADMLSFDLSAIRQSDAPGKESATPNGFLGEEACQITRYAGLSDRLTSVGFYNFNPACDKNRQTSQLLAQMVWYFVEGFYSRKKDAEKLTEKDYYKFMVDVEGNDTHLIFWKSKRSGRWWMEVGSNPHDKKSNVEPLLIPCSYADYQQACNNELPERWFKAYQKLSYPQENMTA